MNPDDDYDDEVELDEGFSAWGVAAILINGIGDVAEAVSTVCQNLSIELAYRHNTTADQTNFITAIKAGLDKL